MNFTDWLVVGLACSLVFIVGLTFARRSSKKGAAGYFAGDRDVPWWAIGLSNTATYSSGTGAFVMLVLVFGIAGNWLWWASWIVWMPLVAIVWARLWRRMQIVTTAELISLRYGGKPALVARKVYAFVCCFGFAVLIISYITGFFAKTIAPLCPLSTWQVLLIFGGITVIYTMFGGLLGVVYADVVQFGIMITGCTVFFVLATAHHGGWHEILHRVREIRPSGLAQTPPTASIDVLTLVVLFLQGWFFAGSPTAGEGMTAQRFMAARNERHAVGGQLFNAFLALSFRTLPLIGLGIVAMSLFWTLDLQTTVGAAPAGTTLLKDPAHAWGELIKNSHLAHGFIGLLVAAEVAAFMGSLSSLINWGGSFVVNDLMPARFAKAEDKVWVSRLTTLCLFIFAATVTILFVDNMVSWFMFINSAMVIFLLPLAWFRFFWWRFNVWGELAAIVLGLPLSILVWFVLGVSPQFTPDEIKNPAALVQRLQVGTDAVSSFVWASFSDQSRMHLTDPKVTPEDQKAVVVEEFNKIVEGNSIYELQRFKGVTLRDHTHSLLLKAPTKDRQARLNRMLLNDAYPLHTGKWRLGFQYKPMWQGLGLLFGLSFIVLIVVTLLTPPESKETLKRFYARCRPPGFWGPIRREVHIEDTGEPTAGRMFGDSMLGILASLGLVLATNAVFVGDWLRFGISVAGCIVTGSWLLKRILDANASEKPQPKPELELTK